MKTVEFNAVIGVIAGYEGNNMVKDFKESGISESTMGKVWMEEAQKEYERTGGENNGGIYISAVVNYSQSLYHKDWGCPDGGEPVFTLEGTANAEFCKNKEAWKESVKNVVLAVKHHFNQSTVTLNFREIEEQCYFREED